MRNTTAHTLVPGSSRPDTDAKALRAVTKPCGQGWQGELFPLEPWGAPTEFAVVDSPHPCIARAMVGPLPLGYGGIEQAKGFAIRCLAATADRGFVACVDVAASDLAAPARFWLAVASGLEAARSDLLRAEFQVRQEAESLAVWSEVPFWVSRLDGNGDTLLPTARARALALAHSTGETRRWLPEGEAIELEQAAHAELAMQIGTGVQHVVQALEPGLAAAMVCRPRLSIAVACRLVGLARLVDERAVRFAMQALSTESLGLLYLASSGNPPTEGMRVRAALFAGHSLPKALRTMGITKTAHRQSLCPSHSTTPSNGLSELQVLGSSWVELMRLLSSSGFAKWPSCAWDGEAVLSTLNRVQPLGLNAALVSRIVAWCMRIGHADADGRASLLLAQSAALVRAAQGVADAEMGTGAAIIQVLSLVKRHKLDRANLADLGALLDPHDVALLVEEVARFTKQDFAPLSTRLLAPVFARHPGAPPGGVGSQMRLLALDSLDFVVDNGHALGTCLADPRVALGYIAQGAALYVLFDPTVGAFHLTIALRLDCSGTAPTVTVMEVVDLDDAVASGASLRRSESLAAAWKPDQLAAWHSYNEAVAELRQRVGLIEGGTDGRQ